jgi:uncharacterized protein YcaQ
MAENQELRKYILDELMHNGPMAVREFHDNSNSKWQSSGWTNGQTVRLMLNYLWEQGEILVSKRKGLTKLWDLRDRCLPEWTPRKDLTWSEVVYRACQRSLRALGVATTRHIERHFTRSNYPNLDQVLDRLKVEGRIQQIEVEEDGNLWPGIWYVHVEDIAAIDRIESGDWQPRTSLLSPFDNLICDRDRAEMLFGFHFRIEIYVPKAKRQYGYYVMPILHGDRLIGRIDPKMDRKSKRLIVNNVYAEADAPENLETGRAVAQGIEELGDFLGAVGIDNVGEVPGPWQPAFS